MGVWEAAFLPPPFPSPSAPDTTREAAALGFSSGTREGTVGSESFTGLGPGSWARAPKQSVKGAWGEGWLSDEQERPWEHGRCNGREPETLSGHRAPHGPEQVCVDPCGLTLQGPTR